MKKIVQHPRQEGKTLVTVMQQKLAYFKSELEKAEGSSELLYYVTSGISTLDENNDRLYLLSHDVESKPKAFTLEEARKIANQQRSKIANYRPMERKEWLNDHIQRVCRILKNYGYECLP